MDVSIKDVPKFAESLKVSISGWVQSIRQAGGKKSAFCFIDLRDGTELLDPETGAFSSSKLQCVIPGHPDLTVESSVRITGVIKTEKRAPGGYELHAETGGYQVIGYRKIMDDIEAATSRDASVKHRLDKRDTMLRTSTVSKSMKLRAAVLSAFRSHLTDTGHMEVTPPTIVQTLCEGGSDLFPVKYFDETAYLTQSSQMYLEPCLAAFGRVYCMQSSYRAEHSTGPRHLAEYTHLEAELPFITFEDLLRSVEDLVCDTASRISSHPIYGRLLQELRQELELPPFELPKRPFKRMTYADAVEYCRTHEIYKEIVTEEDHSETKIHFEYGDDIPSGPERKMIDMIGEPVMMIRFPAEMKSFYMQRCKDGPKDGQERFRETESVDLLLPGVGEIIGGSMRMDSYEELKQSMEEHKMPLEDYSWYLDVRKFGSCPHGGYGLGVERYMMWLCGLPHIREACLFPRFVGRCTP